MAYGIAIHRRPSFIATPWADSTAGAPAALPKIFRQLTGGYGGLADRVLPLATPSISQAPSAAKSLVYRIRWITSASKNRCTRTIARLCNTPPCAAFLKVWWIKMALVTRLPLCAGALPISQCARGSRDKHNDVSAQALIITSGGRQHKRDRYSPHPKTFCWLTIVSQQKSLVRRFRKKPVRFLD